MLNRTLATKINNISSSYPVFLLTGARQVGKTTLLQSLSNGQINYVTLDDLEIRRLAKEDPALFIQKYSPPIIIDEVQYAPELFPYIKIYVDKYQQDGLFWLTGSQKFHLMQGVQESLAGRVAIIDLLGLSYAEKIRQADRQIPFLPVDKWFENVHTNKRKAENVLSIYQKIWQGSYPRLVSKENVDRDIFYRSYVQTYIERDVKDMYNISNNIVFYNFLRAVAARVGQLLNYADIARDINIDSKTARTWLSILEASGIIYLLYPYYNNITKRIIKTPKVYFLDTGLCAYLTSWDSYKTLEAGAMSGAILENYVIIEILKSYWHNGKEVNMYFYRDNNQKEVDCIIEQNGILYPLEIKKTTMPSNVKVSFSFLSKLQKDIWYGGILCLRENIMPLHNNMISIPIWEI